jgi:hypothetical protein
MIVIAIREYNENVVEFGGHRNLTLVPNASEILLPQTWDDFNLVFSVFSGKMALG